MFVTIGKEVLKGNNPVPLSELIVHVNLSNDWIKKRRFKIYGSG